MKKKLNLLIDEKAYNYIRTKHKNISSYFNLLCLKEQIAFTKRRYAYARIKGLGDEEWLKVTIAFERSCRCKICKRITKLVIDHDHVKNKFRGLLCQNCNTAIGMFYNDIKVMKRAIKYLREWENGVC